MKMMSLRFCLFLPLVVVVVFRWYITICLYIFCQLLCKLFLFIECIQIQIHIYAYTHTQSWVQFGLLFFLKTNFYSLFTQANKIHCTVLLFNFCFLSSTSFSLNHFTHCFIYVSLALFLSVCSLSSVITFQL